jgi:hypothetical protein
MRNLCHAQADCARKICNYFSIVCKSLKTSQNHALFFALGTNNKRGKKAEPDKAERVIWA